MKSKPLVSVIIPTYNYGKFVCEAVDSVLQSDFPQNEIEVIVVDDGSTDGTSEIINAYRDRISYIYQENAGKASATKVGINNAQGKYLFNLDSDDLFLPSKIKEVVKVFEKDPDINHVAHPAIYWDVDNDTKTIELIPNLVKENKVCGKRLLSYLYRRGLVFGGGSTFAGRTEVLKNIHIPNKVHLCVDEYLILFTLDQGYSFFLEQPLTVYRIHGKNYTDPASKQQNTNFAKKKNKIADIAESMETTLSSLLTSNFQEDVKKLYFLKTEVAKIAAKEQREEKSLSDIVSVWIYVIKNIIYFKYDTLRIIKSYTLLNRSIPTSMLKRLKQAKRAFARG